jgi:hypothetical protein
MVGVMIRAILGLFTNGLAEQIRGARQDWLNAQTNEARIAAEVRMKELEAEQANRALGGRITSYVQALWVMPFIIYNCKLVIWDKVFALGSTDPLSVELLQLQTTMVMFYFGGATFIQAVKLVKR